MRTLRGRSMLGAVLATTTLLAACGGGSVNSTPTPPTAATPTPTPTATPTPTPTALSASNDTSEYRATVGAVSMNALAAYNKSATGAGIGVAIIDTGIDLQSAEFGARISTASQDVAGTRAIADEDGHGTAVAFTLGGRRNGAGTQGVAYDATLVILRADNPGTCMSGTAGESTCKFNTDAIGRGVDAARIAGARVINMSLGGSEMPQSLMDAIGRATAAGIVVVIAAGNDGTAKPDAFTSVADTASARNQVIIAGSVGANDAISSFSDRAGTSAAHFLTAVGENVQAPDQTGTAYLWTGTSFAAPQISGAVALLAQAFPNLTGAQIVDLLYRTARDMGTAGVDSVYGNGVLDLTRAFQPVGTASVAGTRTAVSMTGNAVLSGAMGDADMGTLGAVILDGYDRAFGIDLARTIARAAPTRTLGGALQTQMRTIAVARGGMSVSMTLAPRANGGVALEGTQLSRTDATAARAIAGVVTQRIGKDVAFGIGFASGASVLTAQLTGAREPAFLVANGEAAGFDTAIRGSSAMRQQFGSVGLTAAVETGDILTRQNALDADRASGRGDWHRSGYDRMSIGLDRRFGALATSLTATRLAERDTLLGARFDTGLGAARATSWFADAKARLALAGGWSLGGSYRQGWSAADVRGGLTGGGTIRTQAFAADIDKDGVFGADSVGLRVAQPLRVASGGIDYTLPTYFDYASNSVASYATQRLNLAPKGRELDIEARYGTPLLGGGMETNLFLRRDPGNYAALSTDYGLAMRYSLGF